MAPPQIKTIIMAVVSLMVIALMFPLGLGLISLAGDYVITAGVAFNATGADEAAITQVLLSDVVDPSVIMLLTVLLPILAVIGVIMYFVPSSRD